MKVTEAIQSRLSINGYAPDAPLDRSIIEEIISLACEAPSSFNIQHWRFVVVSDPEAKSRLQLAAFNQPKVRDASATVIVLGDLLAHESLNQTLAPSVDAGFLPEAVRDQFVTMANGMYSNAAMARDEAIRSGSLAAMTLMLAAAERGLATGPMIGFDPDQVRASFSIPDRYLPVMLITIGTANDLNWPRKPRLPLVDVLVWESGEQLPD